MHNGDLNAASADGNELGMILCKQCGEVMDTVPTNGVKKFYLSCGKPECEQTPPEVNGE